MSGLRRSPEQRPGWNHFNDRRAALRREMTGQVVHTYARADEEIADKAAEKAAVRGGRAYDKQNLYGSWQER